MVEVKDADRKPSVFIGSSTEGRPVAEAIAAGLRTDFHVREWWSRGTFPTSMPPLAILEDELDRRDFAVLVASPDDQVVIRRDVRSAMRDNVLFEFGLFVGKHGRHRCHLVLPQVDGFRVPSDLLHMSFLTYTTAELAKRPVQLTGVVDLLTERIRQTWNTAAAVSVPLLHSRGRRLLRFIAWSRDCLSALVSDGGERGSFQQTAASVLGLSGFFNDDIEELGLLQEYDHLTAMLANAAEEFPQWAIEPPNLEEILSAAHEPRHRYGPYGGGPDSAYVFGRMYDAWRELFGEHLHNCAACLVHEKDIASRPWWRYEPSQWLEHSASLWWNGVQTMESLAERRTECLHSWYRTHRQPLGEAFDRFEARLHDVLCGPSAG